jgi:uncharacterized membrane protein YfcA
MSSDYILSALATVLFGAAVQGILGFGCSLVWMSFFPLFTTVQDAVGILQPLAISLNTLLLCQLWAHAHLKDLQPIMLVAPIGILFGLWVLTVWPAPMINGLLGVFLLAYVSNAFWGLQQQNSKSSYKINYELVERDKNEIKGENDKKETSKEFERSKEEESPIFSSRIAFPAGFVGGCLTSAFGTGGPAILVWANEANWEPTKFRANLQVVFFSMNVLAITSQVWSGIITWRTLSVSIQLVPALILGGWLGTRVAPLVRKDVFRFLTLCGLAIMGVIFVFKAIKDI